MTDTKRDESRDLFLDSFMICTGRTLIERYPAEDKSRAFGGVDVSHYVPASELEAAQERIWELTVAVREFLQLMTDKSTHSKRGLVVVLPDVWQQFTALQEMVVDD